VKHSSANAGRLWRHGFWAHPIAPIVVKLAREKELGILAGIRPWLRLHCKLMLDAISDLLVNDRVM
jgi:hypothetical protein